MKVRELRKFLEDMPPNAEVVYIYYSSDGCTTCGYGASEVEGEIASVTSVDENKTIRLTGY